VGFFLWRKRSKDRALEDKLAYELEQQQLADARTASIQAQQASSYQAPAPTQPVVKQTPAPLLHPHIPEAL
jgi:hypothetical protein